MSTQPPIPPQPNYPPAAPPPDKVAGGSVVKIILIIVGVFVLLGVIAAGVVGYGIYKVSNAVKVDRKSGGVSIETPNGTISTAGSGTSISTADLGIDTYPGATRGEGSMNLKTPQSSMVSAIYSTGDSVAQVVDFYKAKLGENASTIETGNGTMLTSGDNNLNDKVLITVTSDSGKTKIAIVHTTKKN